ncbi:unnamed protein product [Mycena citricolor]|uniref:NACHT domain-containing protein n=1 Tax=Mycena citricolor TaxID=2018698 RepID=A0AAD2Q383_9AGAR|nr:unnamed protein product [Mycena citricolor]
MQETPPTDNATFEVMIAEAIKAYERQTDTSLSQLPYANELQSCRTVEDLMAVLGKHKDSFGQFRAQEERVRAVLKPITSLTQTLLDPAGEVANAFLPGGKSVFIVFAVFLQAARRVSGAYDSLELILTRIRDCLVRLDTYLQPGFLLGPALRDVFVRILIQLVTVFGRLTSHLNVMLGKRQRLLSALRRTKDWAKQLLQADDVNDALGQLDELTKQEGLASLAEIRVATEGAKVASGKAQLASENAQVVSEDVREMIVGQQVTSWLAPYDNGPRYHTLLKSRQSGTCEWFVGGTYQQWLDSSNGLYWLHGNPGAGKSVLLSFLVEHLITQKECVAYHLFDFRAPDTYSVLKMLSSLVYQLGTTSETCHGQLEKVYQLRRSSLSADQDSLHACLLEMIRTSPRRVIIALDALDEFPNPGRKDALLPFLRQLKADAMDNLRLVVTSRREADIHHAVSPLSTHSLDLHDVPESRADDISSYIAAQLALHCGHWSADTCVRVKQTLQERADGMFLWVLLQVQHLRECEESDIEEELANLPHDLKDTYDRILLRLKNEGSFHRTRRLLECIAAGKYSFTTEQLDEILAIDFEWFRTAELPIISQPRRDPEQLIRRRGSSLVNIVQNTRNGLIEVQFVHFTVRDHLLNGSDVLRLNMCSAHATLFAACVAALLTRCSLSSYAVADWTHHSSLVGPREPEIKPLLDHILGSALPLFLKRIDCGPMAEMLTLKRGPEPPKTFPADLIASFDSPLHWATMLGFSQQATGLLDQAKQPHPEERDRYMQAIMRAVESSLRDQNPAARYRQLPYVHYHLQGIPGVWYTLSYLESACKELQLAADSSASADSTAVACA